MRGVMPVALLLQKELRILRNTYFRTVKQVASTVITVVFLGLIVLGVSSAFSRWISDFLDMIPGPLQQEVLESLLYLVFMWVFLVIFFSTVVESREKFLRTPDLGFLISTPISSATVFIFRFFCVTFFSASNISQMVIFGFAPLIGLGLAWGASWYYYLLIFPITYLYIIIPAAVGIAVIMVLVRYVPSKVLFGILTVFNIALVALWIYFVIGDQSILLERLLVLAENLEGVYDYLVPLESAAGMAAVLMGVGEGFFAGLGWLLLSVSLVLGLAVLVIQRVYYQGYERLQVAVPRKKKKKKGAARQLPGQGPISALVGSKWKIVFRNFEMGQAALGLFSLLLAYGVAMYIADPPAKELVMLFNVVVVHFLASWTVGVFFVPAEFLQDRSILKQIYWIFKVTPVSGKVVVRGFYLAVTILSLLLSFMVLVAINLVLGVEAAYWGMSLVLLAMLQLPGGMLDLLVEFQQLGLGAGEAPLVFRILKGAMPFLYAGLFIVLAGFGLYYRYLGFLSFLHHLPEETAFYGGLLAFVALALMVLLASYNLALRCWDNLEI